MQIDVLFTGRKRGSAGLTSHFVVPIAVPPETRVVELPLAVMGYLCNEYEGIQLLRVAVAVDKGQSATVQ